MYVDRRILPSRLGCVTFEAPDQNDQACFCRRRHASFTLLPPKGLPLTCTAAVRARDTRVSGYREGGHFPIGNNESAAAATTLKLPGSTYIPQILLLTRRDLPLMKPCAPSDSPSHSFTHYVVLARRLASSGSVTWCLFIYRIALVWPIRRSEYIDRELCLFSPSAVLPPSSAKATDGAAANGRLWHLKFILSATRG